MSTRFLLCALCVAIPASAADINDLSDNIAWQDVAHGVWKATLGDHSHEMRYTDLAAAPTKTAALNSLSIERFPFDDKKIRYRVTQDHRVFVHIPMDSGEDVFGYGLQFDNAKKTGEILNLKVDHFNKGGGATHAPVPFFISSKGYGVFFNTARYIKVHNLVGNRKDSRHNPAPVDRNPPPDEEQPGPWLAQPPGDAVEAHVHADGLEVVVFKGRNLLDVVSRYNLFNGGGAMPPLWGLGFWHRVPSAFTAEETLAEIAKFEEHKIPLDVIGLEPGWMTKSYPCTFEWQKKRFPDPMQFTQDLLAKGIRLNLWENPYVSPDADIYGKLYPLSGSHLVWLGLVPDYTLPAARKILTDQHRKQHVDIGVSGYKIDEVDGYDFWLWPDHATFPSGTSAEVMRQTYGLQMQSMVFRELFRASDQRTYGLVRASNGAASGYPFVIYSDSYGHKQYINGISSASLGGILWCPEIRSAATEREWINRMHTVCFSPLAMLNAWASGQKPWSFRTATPAVRETIGLRMRLLPYLYTAFAEYHRHGVPPIRSMLLERQTVDQFAMDDSLYMFGPDILVAPFYESLATERTIQLPPGKWYDFYSGEFAGDGANITRNAAQMKDRLPLFVKDGAVIPMLASVITNTDQAYGRSLELRHYGTAAGRCQIYEDDGKSFAYERGTFRIRQFQVDRAGVYTETLRGEGPAMFGPIKTLTRMSVTQDNR